MLQVRDELCIGCGLCERVCPRGAIGEEVEAVSLDEVKILFQSLEEKVKETINKIEKMERRE